MKPLIVANWKCNPTTLREAKELFDSVRNGIRNIKNVETVICPPFVYFPPISSFIVQRSSFKLGAQDCFWEEKGAFTGEISPTMLKDAGCQYVIIGHSERRRYFGETDKMINKKIKAAISVKLKPILCIGETEKERKAGKTYKVLKTQLQIGLSGISSFIVAYEPIWAIGQGKACGITEAQAVNLFIKKTVDNVRLLYGGSVNSQNAKSFIEKANFHGLLVGSASLKPREFIKIVKTISA
jgi:triosephosphate isomerase